MLVETALLKIGGAVLNITMTFIIARAFSIDEAGAVLLFVSLATVFGSFATGGLEAEMTRLSALVASGDLSKNTTVIALLRIPIFVLITSCIFCFIAIENEVFEQHSDMLLPAIIAGCLLAGSRLMCACLQGLGWLKSALLLNQIVWRLLSIIVFLALLFFELVYTKLVILTLLVCVLFSAVASAYVFQQATGFHLRGVFSEPLGQSRWVSIGKAAFWLSLIVSLPNFVNALVSLAFTSVGDTASVALFNVCLQILLVVGFVSVVFNFLLTREFGLLSARGERVLLLKTFTDFRELVFVASLPVVLIVYGLADHVLSIFGVEYVTGRVMLRALLLAQLAFLYFGPVMIFLAMTNNAAIAGISAAIAFAISLILFALLRLHSAGLNFFWIAVMFQVLWPLIAAIRIRIEFGVSIVYLPTPKTAVEKVMLLLRGAVRE
jgi:O-antigen/teichoic acid export membrane protein